MVSDDIRHVRNHGFFIGLICLAFLIGSPFAYARNSEPYWRTIWDQNAQGCKISTNETTVTSARIAQCRQEIEASIAKIYRNHVIKITYFSDIQYVRIERGYLRGTFFISIDQLFHPEKAKNCQAGETPVYPAIECEPKVTCDSPKTSKEFQQAQYACQIGNPNTQLWETDYQWSCQDVAGQPQPNISSSCNYIPNDCIVGLTCEQAEKDVAYCNPAKEDCALPPPNSDLTETTPELPPLDGSETTPPNDEPNFCSMNPHLCEKPTPPEAKPEPNPTPQEKPDNPDLAPGDNEIVQEISLSNQHLENVNANLKSVGGQLLDALAKGNEFSQHQLGVLREMLKEMSNANPPTITTELPTKDDKEEEDKPTEKPMANADCDKSIFECRGDVIQCALLKVQYEDTCTAEEFALLEDAFKGIKMMNNEALLVQPESVDLSRIDSKYLNSGVSFGNSGCPAPERISFRAFGESKSIEFKFDPACHYAELLRPLLIAFAWLTGLFIIGRTQGAV